MSQFMVNTRLERGPAAEECIERFRQDARVERVHVLAMDGGEATGWLRMHGLLTGASLTEATVVAAMLLHGVEVLALTVRELPGSAVAWAGVDDGLVDLTQAAEMLGVRLGVVEAMLDAGLLELVGCQADEPRISRAAVTRMRATEDAGDPADPGDPGDPGD